MNHRPIFIMPNTENLLIISGVSGTAWNLSATTMKIVTAIIGMISMKQMKNGDTGAEGTGMITGINNRD